MDTKPLTEVNAELKELRERIRKFRDERDWLQFHNPKDLSISISLEAAELLEHFQWKTNEESKKVAIDTREEIEDELADVFVYVLELADVLGIDPIAASHKKIEKNDKKYLTRVSSSYKHRTNQSIHISFLRH
mgnify:CR=1 FL=1